MISSRLKISFFQFLSFHLIIQFTLISSNFFEPFNVTYDQRALIIDGHRRMLISAGIHYPRATPEMWPDLIAKSKEGGADVVQTYVFWSGHEPVKGQYYFEGRYDLVKFVKLVGESGLYLHLRIGPYVCAEWNFGGFPVWLRDVPGIVFRTDNAPFKVLQKVPGLHGDVSGDFGLAKLLNKEDHASTALPTINVSRTSCRHTLWIQIGLLVSRHSSSLMESPGEFPTQKDTNKNFSHEASVVFVLGGPASGKGTQCPKIVEHFGFTHLCVGELLEEETKSGSENGQMIRNFKLEGKIVPSEVTMGILQKAMQQSENKKFIIDGFPRNEENLATFEKTVKVEPEFVLFFDPPKWS